MKRKPDVNFPESLPVAWPALGHEVETTRQMGLPGRPDPTEWQATRAAGRAPRLVWKCWSLVAYPV